MNTEEQGKQPKTPEELAAIAYLDKLRTCEGEEMPVGLPLACVVKVIGYEEVPKASEQYAMATVEGRDGQSWRVCIRRYYLEEGMRALFVSYDALLPEGDERFDNLDFHELLKARVGDVCAAKLHIESAEELQRRAAAPQPKKKTVFQPKPVKDDFLAKLRLHRKRYGW